MQQRLSMLTTSVINIIFEKCLSRLYPKLASHCQKIIANFEPEQNNSGSGRQKEI